MTLGDISIPTILALIAIVTALASLAGRARDKATISAYKDNAEAQDLTIRNQGAEIVELKAANTALDTRCTVLEDTANSGEKIDAQTVEIKLLREEQTKEIGLLRKAVDDHAEAAESWWGILHADLSTRGRRTDDA